MTDKPTPEQIQRACDLAGEGYQVRHYGDANAFTALADTIAQLDAMQAERDKARADLGEIGDDLACYADDPHVDDAVSRSARRAATYRVETDPLVAVMDAIGKTVWADVQAAADALRAELAKRGLEIGRAA